jgi:hypothetical protein
MLKNKLPKSIKKVWRNTGLLNLSITSIGFFIGLFLSFNNEYLFAIIIFVTRLQKMILFTKRGSSLEVLDMYLLIEFNI